MTIDLTAATAACIDRVRLYDNVSFPELRRVIDAHHIPTHGDVAMELTKCPNLYLWAGMSDEFLTIAGTLYTHEHIEMRPTHVLTYLADGGMLALPVAKRPPKHGYREPHWCPSVFKWTGPRPTAGQIKAEMFAMAADS